MFKKILIANRGEIACRVIRTAQKMGIATVAVYSDADARAPHVRMADESVRLGPPPAAESLSQRRTDHRRLQGDRRRGGASGLRLPLRARELRPRAAPRPGSPSSGRRRRRSPRWATRSNRRSSPRRRASTSSPASSARSPTPTMRCEIAGEIGYPVMMKASAGGGGKGMRLACSEQDVREGFEATKREGLASFGDDRVFIEKFIEQPAPYRDPAARRPARQHPLSRRARMLDPAPPPEGGRGSAVALRHARDAQGDGRAGGRAGPRRSAIIRAGTVELIVSGADPTGESFYFLEMNTRLQVEHPVTEMVTGLDLVEQMIRVAAGEKLAFGQDEVRLDGWAIENRVYAEDPYRGFLPSTGRLVRYRPPAETHERGRLHAVDDGVAEGGEVCDVLRSDDRQAGHLGADPRGGDRPPDRRRSTRSRSRGSATMSISCRR